MKALIRSLVTVVILGMLWAGRGGAAYASNHLDTPTTIANPEVDIGDIFAWTSPNGRQLNLVMTIVGHSFSDKFQYIFHVDSGAEFGKTTASTSIVCRFSAPNIIDCQAGQANRAVGDASKPGGLDGGNHRLRVFAGLRDDPVFNNVKGSRDALQYAAAALRSGTVVDAA